MTKSSPSVSQRDIDDAAALDLRHLVLTQLLRETEEQHFLAIASVLEHDDDDTADHWNRLRSAGVRPSSLASVWEKRRHIAITPRAHRRAAASYGIAL